MPNPIHAPTPLRRVLLTLCALAAFALPALSAPALSAAGPARLDTGFQDPLDPEFADPDAAHAYAVARAQRVRYIRIAVAWSNIAFTKPAHPRDFRDPAYQWSALDARVRGIRSHGMQPILVLYAPPKWAQDESGDLTPTPSSYAAFAEAAAKRYNGQGGRPRVRYWQAFNEPNIWIYFSRTRAPQRYRALVNAAAGRIHGAAKGNVVIAGGLGPIGGGPRSMAPLKFMRAMLCVSKGAHPHRTCKTRSSFDVWSHHPYTSGGPTHGSPNADEVELGDMPQMRRLLNAARRLHRIRSHGSPLFWVTEFSWDTKPPDPYAVPVARHARWVAEALYRMWNNGVSTVIWFQLRDAPKAQFYSWEGGLFGRSPALYSSAKEKPFARVLRFPFAAVPKGRRVTLWGRTPDRRRHRVVIQRRTRGHWRRVVRLRSTSHGIFHSRRRGLRGALLRASVGGAKSRPFTATRTKDIPVNPFGNRPVGGQSGGGSPPGGNPPPDDPPPHCVPALPTCVPAP